MGRQVVVVVVGHRREEEEVGDPRFEEVEVEGVEEVEGLLLHHLLCWVTGQEVAGNPRSAVG